jgi:hypothetical protein
VRTTLQRWLLAFGALTAILVLWKTPSIGGLSIQQRSQQTVYILVNVTGIARNRTPARPVQDDAIAARFALRAKGSQPSVDAVAFSGATTLVAQTQRAVRVEAEVTPNPNATLLVTNQSNITLNGTAGTTITQQCAYTLTSNAVTISSWTIKQGLASDFTTSWPGRNLANNSYLQAATPQPTATPFVVYPSAWTIMATNGNQKTYCVDLTLTIPSTIPTGAYSTTAVYTIWY